MRHFILAAAITFFMLTTASFSYAYHIDITNKCAKDVMIEVKGDHFFWRQVDCRVTVPAGGSETCSMPGAICPSSVRAVEVGTNKFVGNESFSFGFAACWNNKVELELLNTDCKMVYPTNGW